MIPKVIHYCWFGNKKMPKKAMKCIKSWHKYCPDYKIIKWNENNFDININLYVKQAYENKKWAFVTDYARLWIVEKYGGIYLDTDVELIKNLDSLLDNEAYFGIESTKNNCVATGLGFGAEKNNIVVKSMLQDYDGISFIGKNKELDLTPCPDRNSLILEKFGFKYNNKCQKIENALILSCEYLCPKDFVTGKIFITKNTFSIHHYDGSWVGVSTKIKVMIAKILRYKIYL